MGEELVWKLLHLSGDVVGQMFAMFGRDSDQERLDKLMVDLYLRALAEAVEDLAVVLLVRTQPHVRESGQRFDDLRMEAFHRRARLHWESK